MEAVPSLHDQEAQVIHSVVSLLCHQGEQGSLEGNTYNAPKHDAKFKKGKTHLTLHFGVFIRGNRPCPLDVAELPDPLRDLFMLLQSRIPALSRLPGCSACTIEVFESGQWLPSYQESECFQSPIVRVCLESEQALDLLPTTTEPLQPNQNSDPTTTPEPDLKDGKPSTTPEPEQPKEPFLKVAPGSAVLIYPGTKYTMRASNSRRVAITFRCIHPEHDIRKKVASKRPVGKPTPKTDILPADVPCPPDTTKGVIELDDTIDQTPEIEREHVHNVYNTIASHWDRTRHKPWPRVKKFILDQPEFSLIADVGCGNGKYMGIGRQMIIGCDRSASLLQICNKQGYEVHVCDNMALPYRDNTFDAALSIAVLHHFSTPARRFQALKEMARIIRPGGQFLVYAWALEQGPESRRNFQQQDVLVPWHHHNKAEVQPKPSTHHKEQSVQKDAVVYRRYCHVYKKGELEHIVSQIANIRVVESFYDTSNWCVIAEKGS
eukprot:m.17148 g.17148  ORF g.17148 m.17148 type:complete len:491 (-) comp10988_c0_seq1:54-1526(-)